MHFVTFYVLFYNISDLLSSAKASELPASSFQPAYLYDMLEVRGQSIRNLFYRVPHCPYVPLSPNSGQTVQQPAYYS